MAVGPAKFETKASCHFANFYVENYKLQNTRTGRGAEVATNQSVLYPYIWIPYYYGVSG